jgi:hypothetical protein
MKNLTLTVNEIADLARFAGIALDETRLPDADEGETEISVGPCPKGGLYEEEDGPRTHYRLIAWLEEYPEEGSMGLGPEMPQPSDGED